MAQHGGQYDEGYGQQGDGYYHDEQGQAYYDHNQAYDQQAPQGGEGYYDDG